MDALPFNQKNSVFGLIYYPVFSSTNYCPLESPDYRIRTPVVFEVFYPSALRSKDNSRVVIVLKNLSFFLIFPLDSGFDLFDSNFL